MKLNGSDIIIECLLEQGVDTVFGYPGGAVLNIYDALYKYKDKIKHYITAHEQGACHAADGYSNDGGLTGAEGNGVSVGDGSDILKYIFAAFVVPKSRLDPVRCTLLNAS